MLFGFNAGLSITVTVLVGFLIGFDFGSGTIPPLWQPITWTVCLMFSWSATIVAWMKER